MWKIINEHFLSPSSQAMTPLSACGEGAGGEELCHSGVFLITNSLFLNFNTNQNSICATKISFDIFFLFATGRVCKERLALNHLYQ